MYLIRTPRVIQSLFPNFLWRVSTDQKQLYLTFDDGPIPEVTPWVLDQLAEYDAKATFFCVGENVQRYPKIFKRTVEEGHTVGNHTYNHLSGWANENIPYFHNVRSCAHLVNSNLFRPPYGRMKPKQVQFLQRHYRIVMWDVLSGDFDGDISGEQCYHNVLQSVRPGSIVVFHDSLKAQEKVHYALPRTLRQFSEQGFTFERLSSKALRGNPSLKQTA
jgi:peptidoglycan/xylan/chitin deacetylase (PgdA/CDA1 family)